MYTLLVLSAFVAFALAAAPSIPVVRIYYNLRLSLFNSHVLFYLTSFFSLLTSLLKYFSVVAGCLFCVCYQNLQPIPLPLFQPLVL